MSETHPFLAAGHWVQAGELRVGDTLRNAVGGATEVVSVETVDRGVRVYNIEVDGTHVFFVNGLLVHNKPDPWQ